MAATHEAERLGGFQIDDQLEFCRLNYGQVGGLRRLSRILST